MPDNTLTIALRETKVPPPDDYTEFPDIADGQTIPRQFQEICRRFPRNLALSGPEKSFTYQELDRTTDHLAQSVMRHGLRPGERIAVIGHTGPDTVVALLAALKCGAIVVPIDPFYPDLRNAEIVKCARASLAIAADGDTVKAAALGFSAEQIIDPKQSYQKELAWDIPLPEVLHKDTCWLIFTSGSTGRPKGVALTHKSMLHVCMRRSRLLRISPSDRLVLIYSCSVHGGLNHLLGALLNGASLHTWESRIEGLAGLENWLREKQITLYHSVPSILRRLAATRVSRPLENLRVVTLGGESVLVSDVNHGLNLLPENGRVVNGIGSTETGIFAAAVFGHDNIPNGKVIPSGKAMPGIQIQIKNSEGEALPAGVEGEIFLTSSYLTQGYWEDAEETAKRFLPAGTEPELRTFRTGDLGCLDKNGVLWHYGRSDFQVKIRGYRVEVGEIESVLYANAKASSVAVFAPLNIGGERELVAFVAPGTAHDALTTSESLYTCCSRHLPPNLIPARFIIRDKLPQTPTGKIDRRSLLLELESQTDRKTETSTPKPHEDLLSQVKDLWAQALNLDQIEDDTDFFLAGGNSLSAMELLIKVGNLVGQTITFADFVHCPTPRQLSDFLQRYPAQPRPNLVILREDGEGIPLFCIPPWNGSRTYFQRLVQQLVPGFPVYGLEPEMDDSDQVRATNLAELVACHRATLESAWPEGEVRLIGYSNGACIAWELATLLIANGRKVTFLGNIDDVHPAIEHARESRHYLLFFLEAFLKYPLKMPLLALRVAAWHFNRAIQDRRSDGNPMTGKIKEALTRKARVMANYRPKPAPLPLTVFKASRPLRSAAMMEKNLGWEISCTQGVTTIRVEGTHESIVRGKHVANLAQRISEALDSSV